MPGGPPASLPTYKVSFRPPRTPCSSCPVSSRVCMAACSLLSQEHQSSRCELGLSFGCGSGYLWTAHGCAGRFLCEGKPLLCGVDRALCRCEGGRLPGGALALNGDGEGLAALYRREQRTSCAAHTTEIALGVLGNSITVGVGTVNAKRNCWPALLQSSLGPRYRIINRGVRASRADLALSLIHS